MEAAEEDDDLKLIKASAGLLADLEHDLPRLLFKPSKSSPQLRCLHTWVKKRHLDRVVSLIETFQGEPQLLDAKLKNILPLMLDAYLELLSSGPRARPNTAGHVPLQLAICTLLYTLCKVRGHKIIVGFLSNEPRHLEPVLDALEQTITASEPLESTWKVPYVLLLWLSHLLLTPFDLVSISNKSGPLTVDNEHEPERVFRLPLPPFVSRILRAALTYVDTPTKAQDAAAAMLVRLSIRPDVQGLGVADALIEERLLRLSKTSSQIPSIYQTLGALRLVAGTASSAELGHLVPDIYRTCEQIFGEDEAPGLLSNAVAKKLAVKIFRNVAILALRSRSLGGGLALFLQTTDVLENVIDYLLRSLGDKDTPVRYASAKALSLIILELDADMGHEIVQAVIDSFKEDMPSSSQKAHNFATVDALRWHGLTLTLAHTLFKRSASPRQLPEILDALIAALQFQQRTATGTTLGTNVRDAANFGIWSLCRRYTTAELSPVKATSLQIGNQIGSDVSIIPVVAIQLILSACLDPAGNIRRGSSAALQELVGRHQNQVNEGIALVQIVDYQAVSLRHRAMIQVAKNASSLDPLYWRSLLRGLLGWRGLGSSDVPSRQSAATAIAELAIHQADSRFAYTLDAIVQQLQICRAEDVESLHGIVSTMAHMMKSPCVTSLKAADVIGVYDLLHRLNTALVDFNPRMLRSEYPAALAQLTAALCEMSIHQSEVDKDRVPFDAIDNITDKLLWRHEEWILTVVSDLVRSVFRLKRSAGRLLDGIEARNLTSRVAVDGHKSSFHGAGRVLALGVLAPLYDPIGLAGDDTALAVRTLCDLLGSTNMDFRILGVRALRLIVGQVDDVQSVDKSIAGTICVAAHQGLNDYTIDERGDIGSLVRMQSLACTADILGSPVFQETPTSLQVLKADIYRLSLEKLDKVRLQAALIRQQFIEPEKDHNVVDVATASSLRYFEAALSPLASYSTPEWTHRALLEGCMLCAGTSAEALLAASRNALVSILDSMGLDILEHHMTLYIDIVKNMLVETSNTQPALEVLGFLLDMGVPQLLATSPTFKWRNLLSVVQKSHHKSTDVPKVLAAVRVYANLADVAPIREEVLKKILGMLKTNPYPRVRLALAEALLLITSEQSLKACDWTLPVGQYSHVVEDLQRRYIGR